MVHNCLEVKEVNVLFLQPQPCVRALKYAKGLKWALKNDVSIYFGYLRHTLNHLYGYGDEFFDGFFKMEGDLEKGIRDLVIRHDIDIIHSHNAPDLLTVIAVEASDGVPVVHDVHEVLSLIDTGYYAGDTEKDILRYREEERLANEGSDGRIYPTYGVRNFIRRSYTVDPSRDLVFCNYVSRFVMPSTFKDKLSRKDGETHIVYIGTVTSTVEGNHYDLREIFKEVARHEMHLHVYTTIEDDAYRELAEGDGYIHYHGHLDRKTLMDEITQYDFGWAGFNGVMNKNQLEIGFPNKVMEYVACGLPVLSFPHRAIEEFIENNGVGFVFKDLDELADRLMDEEGLEDMRRNALNLRGEFTVEGNIGRVVDFYHDLMNGSCGRSR